VALAFGCGIGKNTTGTGDLTGNRLGVFASDRGQSAGQFDLYLWDYDYTTYHSLGPLNSTAAERHPSLSSDGRFIAFQVNRGTGTGDDVEMFDRSKNSFIELPGLNGPYDDNEPTFTGDGLKLCYVQRDAVGRRHVRLYDGTTKAPVPLPGLDTTGVSYDDYSPSANRDGSIIAFVTDRAGTPDIYLYDRSRHQILDVPELRSGADDVDPHFSNGGQFLTFSSNRAGGVGGFDLYLLEFSSFPVDTLLADVHAANSPLDERHPCVSDNGGVIVFQSNRADGLGRIDLWNFDRASGKVGQGSGYSSPSDDIEPSIKWPN
jgi:Tol biopolymer transport system component